MAEQKFKVGDRVRIIDGGIDGWTEDQCHGVVVDADFDSEVVYKDNADGSFRRATEDELELDPDAAPVDAGKGDAGESLIARQIALLESVKEQADRLESKADAEYAERKARHEANIEANKAELRRRERLELVGKLAARIMANPTAHETFILTAKERGAKASDFLAQISCGYADAILAHLDATEGGAK